MKYVNTNPAWKHFCGHLLFLAVETAALLCLGGWLMIGALNYSKRIYTPRESLLDFKLESNQDELVENMNVIRVDYTDKGSDPVDDGTDFVAGQSIKVEINSKNIYAWHQVRLPAGVFKIRINFMYKHGSEAFDPMPRLAQVKIDGKPIELSKLKSYYNGPWRFKGLIYEPDVVLKGYVYEFVLGISVVWLIIIFLLTRLLLSGARTKVEAKL